MSCFIWKLRFYNFFFKSEGNAIVSLGHKRFLVLRVVLSYCDCSLLCKILKKKSRVNKKGIHQNWALICENQKRSKWTTAKQIRVTVFVISSILCNFDFGIYVLWYVVCMSQDIILVFSRFCMHVLLYIR